jgi:hypothetical protein
VCATVMASDVRLSMAISSGVVVASDQIYCVLLRTARLKISVSMATHYIPP